MASRAKTVSEELPDGLHIHTTTEIRGVAAPPWLAFTFLLAFSLSLSFLGGAMLYLGWRIEELQESVDINTIYSRDVGAILIREGISTPRDFTVGPLNEERQTKREVEP